MSSVATFIELLFQLHSLRGRHVAAPSFEFMMKGVTLSSLPQPCESHTLELPVLSLSERFHCHFLQFPSYRRRITAAVYLSRDSFRLRARSHFDLLAGETAAPQSGIRGHPALFFCHTTSCDSGLDFLSTLLRSTEPCRVEHSCSSLCVHRHLNLPVLAFLAYGASRLALPHSFFVTVRSHGIHGFNPKIKAA